MPLTGYNSKSVDSISKTKTSAADCFEIKYPGRKINDCDQRMTCPLDIKYSVFVKDKSIVKTLELQKREVVRFINENFLPFMLVDCKLSQILKNEC